MNNLFISGGSVYELHERSGISTGGGASNNIRCIFAGCRGEVVTLDYVPSLE